MKQTINKDLINNSSILVTGGAGFIGSNIVETLLAIGAKKIRVLDDFSNGHRRNIEPFLANPTFEFIEGDIRHLDTCKEVCAGMDYVLHQAALGSVPRSINNPITTNAVNVNGFLNMLEAVRHANVKRMVYAASSSTYGDSKILPKVEDQIGKPLSPYAVTKYVNELYAHVYYLNYGVESIGLRYFNVFGPKQDPNGAYAAAIPLFIQSVLNNSQVTIHGDGEQTRDFTFVQNAVQANLLALSANNKEVINQVFNIAAGNQVTVNDMWKSLNILAHKNIQPQYKEARKGDVIHSKASIEKARKLLGYEPEVPFEEGLRRTFKWFLDSGLFNQPVNQ
jgi:UDP-N-acetylglucosamine/UDP-N-acetylgalactosamine 4-epimerase